MRLLLVEDDQPLAGTLQSLLREHHYTVDWVDDGRQALNALSDERFDVIVLDLTLPGLDGLQVISRARQQGINTPIIVLTARGELGNRLEGLDAGADDYLPKPFAFDELLARLRAVIRRTGGQGSPTLDIGSLQIDPAHFAITLADQPLAVSRSEFMLLHCLARNAGKVVTRSRLEEQLYGWEEGVESNALEVHIHNLRKKIGKAGIRTVRGVGYLLDPAALSIASQGTSE